MPSGAGPRRALQGVVRRLEAAGATGDPGLPGPPVRPGRSAPLPPGPVRGAAHLPGQPALPGGPPALPGAGVAVGRDRRPMRGRRPRRHRGPRPCHRGRILRRGGAEETLDADLVLDATGRRAAPRPGWRASATTQPPVDQLPIQVRYASRHLRLRPGALGGGEVRRRRCRARPPHRLRAVRPGGRPVDPDGVRVRGPPPATDPEGLLEFVEAVAPPDSSPRSATPSRSTTSPHTGSRPTPVALRADAALPRRPAGLRRRDL